ncbi:MAG: RNA polymerase sigma factor [Bacteroidales bacterium]|nr:RNA polymerase sigma factor [Bacteroidales bacterium]
MMHNRDIGTLQPDADMIHKCRNRDEKAFRILVEKFQSYAFNLAFRLVLNEDDAKDIIQESFIRIWKHIHQYDQKILFTTWLYKIVINLCYDNLKSTRRRNHMAMRLADNQAVPVINDNASGNEDNKELIRKIRKLSKTLTLKQRMVFILRDLLDLPVKEVSGILGLSEGSVKTNLYLARLNIREKILVSEKHGGS